MNKLSKKFITGIIIILVSACLSSILFNTKFLEKYYLYQKRMVITSVCKKFTDLVGRGVSTEEAINQTETSNKVIIVQIENTDNISSDEVSDEIRTAFQNKGIGFQKYWLWEGDYKKILNGENRIRLYKQENLNYSLLVEYIQSESQLFAVTMIIPNIADAFRIINNFLICVNAATIIIAIIFIIVLIQKITKPLHEFKNFALQMKNGDFIPLEIHTKDELESVADSLNSMGSQIISYQQSLQEKNQQMEQLLDNVAHDLKTPVSLIQLYTSGIKDGLDDGTFLDTILMKNKEISDMINRLLYVSQIDKKGSELAPLNLTALLYQLINECSVFSRECGITICPVLEEDIIVVSSGEMMKSLLINLITNAVKYSSGSQIDIKLYQTETEINFSITNETNNKDLDLSKIWMPYYVGEQSRSKKLSGTGLGLTIVNKICEKLLYSVKCSLDGNLITFTLKIPIKN